MREITESLVCNLGRRHFVLNVKNGEVGNEWMCKFVQGALLPAFLSITHKPLRGCDVPEEEEKEKRREGQHDGQRTAVYL